jgi:hypothetical protein
MYKFSDVVDVARASACSICNTFVYTLPCQLDDDFEKFMPPFGGLKYSLKKTPLIQIDNDLVVVNSRTGRSWIDVKFKHDIDSIKPLFDLQIAAYVSMRNQIEISLDP